jgi:hypothetical protein
MDEVVAEASQNGGVGLKAMSIDACDVKEEQDVRTILLRPVIGWGDSTV